GNALALGFPNSVCQRWPIHRWCVAQVPPEIAESVDGLEGIDILAANTQEFSQFTCRGRHVCPPRNNLTNLVHERSPICGEHRFCALNTAPRVSGWRSEVFEVSLQVF